MICFAATRLMTAKALSKLCHTRVKSSTTTNLQKMAEKGKNQDCDGPAKVRTST